MTQPLRDPGDTVLSCLDAGSLGRRIVAALPTMFASGVSLHDASGTCQWRSGGLAGASEHMAVRAALESFVGQTAPSRMDRHLPDGTSAILLISRSTDGAFTGFVMLIVGTARLKAKGRAAPDLPIPVIRAARHWGDLAGMHAAGAALANDTARTEVDESPKTQPRYRKRHKSPEQIEQDRCSEALRKFPLALFAQRLMPLHAEARIRRYEVLLRGNSTNAPENAPETLLRNAEAKGVGSIMDRRVVTALVVWLRKHARVWEAEPSQFSVNLSMSSLADRHFMSFVQACLEKAELPAGILVFEVDQQRARAEHERITALAEACQTANAGLVLDNFTLHDNSVDLLMLPGLRLLKIDRRLTLNLATSRSAQAVVAGIAQMARVAGVHSVAKQVETTEEHALLTSLGVDFVQSFASFAPVPLERLHRDITSRMIVDNTALEEDFVPSYLASKPY